MVASESRYKGLRDNGKGQRRGLDTVFTEIIWLFGLSRASRLLPATPLLPPRILKQLDSYRGSPEDMLWALQRLAGWHFGMDWLVWLVPYHSCCQFAIRIGEGRPEMCRRVVGSDIKPWGSLTLWLGMCVCVSVVLVADRVGVMSQGPWEASREQDLPHLAGHLFAQLSAPLQPVCGARSGAPCASGVWKSSVQPSGVGWTLSQDGKQMGGCSSWGSGLTQASLTLALYCGVGWDGGQERQTG